MISACQRVSSPLVEPSTSDKFCKSEFNVKGFVGSNDIHSLDVLVFRTESGILESHVRSESTSVSINVISGTEVDFFIYANAPEGVFDKVYIKEHLSGLLSDLSDNTSSQIMFGSGSDIFYSDKSVTVPLERFANRLVIDSILPVFVSPSIAQAEFTIDAIYLINVYGSCTYEGKTGGDLWYNKLKWDNTLPITLKGLLRHDLDRKVTDSSVITLPKDRNTLHFYPNEYDNNITSKENPQWSERNTRLVVETTFGQTKYYYPVTLPSLKRNDSYHITELRLLGLGSDDPDIPLGDRVEISYYISLEPWSKSEQDITLETVEL